MSVLAIQGIGRIHHQLASSVFSHGPLHNLRFNETPTIRDFCDVMNQVAVPDDAPFSAEQREWLSSYLSTILAPYANFAVGLPASEKTDAVVNITIAWGSQTGTAESLANEFADLASKAGTKPTVVDLERFDFDSLQSLEYLVLITSTYGMGEPPDNAQSFYDYLHGNEAPSLESLNYAVLALGDSNYPDFCQAGVDFDNRLRELGATPIIERVDLDVDYDDEYNLWTNDLLSIVGSGAVMPDELEKPALGRKNPCTVEVLRQHNLNDASSERETTHVEISLRESGLSYEAGDALGVFPINDPDLVDDLIESLGFAKDESVGDKTFRQALLEDYEIRNITPPVFEALVEKSDSRELKALLANEKKQERADFLWGLEIYDLVTDYSIGFDSPKDFLGVLKPLAPRLYSIASSPKAHPDEVHLTVGAVSYHSKGRVRKGVCSTYFSERTALARPRVFVHPNKSFRPPADPSAPMIMVGPGTGIAPFRSFLEERHAIGADGDNWLFFGNPHRHLDFLYEEELEELQRSGCLDKLSLAFSRDQEKKLYVQHLMFEEGQELFRWLERDGHFYVCGDASRMAKDVDYALHKVIEICGKMSADDAKAYVAKLKAEKRYARDVY